MGAGAPQGIVTLYRCFWTLAAGALVLFVTFVYPSRVPLCNVEEKLSSFTQAIETFTREVQKQCTKRHDKMEESSPPSTHDNDSALSTASSDSATKIEEARLGGMHARIALFKCINEALTTPTCKTGSLIEPHTLAKCLASDLMSAGVIPQTVLLVADGSADSLLSDIDDETYAELNRLQRRFEFCSVATSDAVLSSPSGRGPFSNAIARAHCRLDEARIVSDPNQMVEVQTS